jgi:hypothetical protein
LSSPMPRSSWCGRLPSKPLEGTSQKYSATAKSVYRGYLIYCMFAIYNYPL